MAWASFGEKGRPRSRRSFAWGTGKADWQMIAAQVGIAMPTSTSFIWMRKGPSTAKRMSQAEASTQPAGHRVAGHRGDGRDREAPDPEHRARRRSPPARGRVALQGGEPLHVEAAGEHAGAPAEEDRARLVLLGAVEEAAELAEPGRRHHVGLAVVELDLGDAFLVAVAERHGVLLAAGAASGTLRQARRRHEAAEQVLEALREAERACGPRGTAPPPACPPGGPARVRPTGTTVDGQPREGRVARPEQEVEVGHARAVDLDRARLDRRVVVGEGGDRHDRAEQHVEVAEQLRPARGGSASASRRRAASRGGSRRCRGSSPRRGRGRRARGSAARARSRARSPRGSPRRRRRRGAAGRCDGPRRRRRPGARRRPPAPRPRRCAARPPRGGRPPRRPGAGRRGPRATPRRGTRRGARGAAAAARRARRRRPRAAARRAPRGPARDPRACGRGARRTLRSVGASWPGEPGMWPRPETRP